MLITTSITDLPTLNDRDICHRIEALYHKQLDVHNLQINGIGDCRSGRKVITELLRLQKTCSLVSAGSSSWIVAPTDEGKMIKCTTTNKKERLG